MLENLRDELEFLAWAKTREFNHRDPYFRQIYNLLLRQEKPPRSGKKDQKPSLASFANKVAAWKESDGKTPLKRIRYDDETSSDQGTPGFADQSGTPSPDKQDDISQIHDSPSRDSDKSTLGVPKAKAKLPAENFKVVQDLWHQG